MLVLEGHTSWTRSLAYTPNGNLLISVGDDCMVRLWDVSTGRSSGSMKGHTEGITALSCSPDGNTLLTGGQDATVCIWDLTKRALSHSRRNHSVVTSVAFSPDGKYYAWGLERTGDGKKLHILPTGKIGEGQLPSPSVDSVWAIDFVPGGKHIALGLGSGSALLWNPFQKKIEGDYWHGVGIRGVACSPVHPLLAVMTGAEVKIWDYREGAPLRTLGDPGPDFVWSMAFSPDGKLLATGCWDSVVRLWDVASGRQVQQFDWDLGRAHAVAFSPDGMTAAAAGDSGEIVIFDIDEM